TKWWIDHITDLQQSCKLSPIKRLRKPREERAMSEFHRLLEQQIPRLRRYARVLTRNPDRADDLVQDTLSRALEKQHLWQPGTNLGAWLLTIMHNQNVNNVRRDVREFAAVELARVATPLPATPDPSAQGTMLEFDV